MVAYAARTKDRDLLLRSSSGGVFTELAKVVLSQQGVVYGCVWKHPEMVAVHARAEHESELEPMRGSKYVPSDISLAVKQLPVDLAQGRKVLFTGTPCQIAAVRKRVESDGALKPFRSNLFLVEIICHGVPEPEVWEEYKRQLGKPIADVRFKDKRTGWKNPTMVVEFSDGSLQVSKLYANPFIRAYMSGLAIREVCFNCAFKDGKSGADLTIGDLWGYEERHGVWADNGGVSVALIRTRQGERLWEQGTSSLTYELVLYDDVISHNPNLIRSTVPQRRRKRFMRLYRRKPMAVLVRHLLDRQGRFVFVQKCMCRIQDLLWRNCKRRSFCEKSN